MIDLSKLKYYTELCEKGLLDKDSKADLNSTFTLLEEKQFELLKRLETTTDERRKEEINEQLNIVDMQLQELAAINSTINSGIIVREETEAADTEKATVDVEAQLVSKEATKERNRPKLIIAIAVLACVIAGSAFAITNSINNLHNSTSTDAVTVEEEYSDDEDNNKAELGIGGIDDGLEAQEQFDSQGQGDEGLLSEGIYVFDIYNKTLIDGGLELGDLIVSLNGEKVLVFNDLNNVVARYKPGDECKLVVERNHEEVTVIGKFVKQSDLMKARTGTGTFKINGRSFEFDYDTGNLTLKGE